MQLDPLPQRSCKTAMVKKDLPMAVSIRRNRWSRCRIRHHAVLRHRVGRRREQCRELLDAEVDRLLAKGQTDNVKRPHCSGTDQETVQNDLAWLPVVETKTEWAFSTRLSGITWHPENSIHFIDLTLAP